MLMQHSCIFEQDDLPLPWQVCKSCGEEKPACEFTRYRMRRDGLYNWCKQCDIWKRQERRKRKRDEAYTMAGGLMQASNTSNHSCNRHSMGVQTLRYNNWNAALRLV